MSDTSIQKRERPLSPHLQVYRPQLTSVTSIFHRFTGVALIAGILLVIWWLVAAMYGEEAYNAAMAFSVSPIGQIILLGLTFSLFYHMANGIRHLIWDMGYLFKLENAYKAGYACVLFAIVATAYVWVVA
jgi:succinate dehydrogenase / fumarate reductase cytochrome b subunit